MVVTVKTKSFGGLLTEMIGLDNTGAITGVKVTAENEQFTSFPYVFLLGAAVMIIGMLVVRIFVKEPSSLEEVAANNQYADEKAAKKRIEKLEKKYQDVIEKYKVFARVSPEHKVEIVKAFDEFISLVRSSPYLSIIYGKDLVYDCK